MDKKHLPEAFRQLQSTGSVKESDILKTPDGFWLIYKSLSDVLAENNIFDFPNSDGERLLCSKFYMEVFDYEKNSFCYTCNLSSDCRLS